MMKKERKRKKGTKERETLPMVYISIAMEGKVI
jgi:hypothetical protein